MTGQDAVNTAKAFNEKLNFDGVVLTKLDGDTRGGAALRFVRLLISRLSLSVVKRWTVWTYFTQIEWLVVFWVWVMLFL